MMVEEGREWDAHIGTRFHRKMKRRAEHGHEWEARKRAREAEAAKGKEQELESSTTPQSEQVAEIPYESRDVPIE